MKSDEEGEKRKKLRSLFKDWICGKSDIADLLLYRANDMEWVDREMMCYALREDVFHVIDWNTLFNTLSSECIDFVSENVQVALTRLINSMKYQLRSSEQSEWENHEKLCMVMEVVFRKHNKSISEQMCHKMFAYLMKIIDKCDQNQTIDCAIYALGEFPFDIYDFSVLQLIKSTENHLKNVQLAKWDKHANWCKVIREVLRKYKHSLGQETCERIFDYLNKLIETSEHESTIVLVFQALRQYPFVKYQYLLLLMIDMMESQLNSEQSQWERHVQMCEMISWVLRRNVDSISDKTCNRMFNYMIKLISRCENGYMIKAASDALKQARLEKFQLLHSIVLPNILLNLEYLDFKNCELLQIIILALKNDYYLLHQEILEEIFNLFFKLIQHENNEVFAVLTWFLFEKFPLEFPKYQTILLQLVDSFENELNTVEKDRGHVNLCRVLWWMLWKCEDQLNHKTYERMFDYFIKLIQNEHTIDCAFDALGEFPFEKFQISQQQLIDLMEHSLNSEQSRMDKHGKLCEMIEITLRKCRDSLSQQTCQRMCEYLVKLIETCEDEKIINSAFCALRQFSFDKYKSALLPLMNSMKSQLNSKGWKNTKHLNLSYLLKHIFKKYKNLLSFQTCEQIFSKLVMLLDMCEDEQTIRNVFEAMYHFPFHKDKHSLVTSNDRPNLSIKLTSNYTFDVSINSTNKTNHSLAFTHKWMIENFCSLFAQNATPLSVIYSETFPVSEDVVFSLRMIPAYEDDDTFVSIFLYMEECLFKSIPVKYRISLINIEPDKTLLKDEAKIFKVEEFWGWEKFIKLSHLLEPSNGFLTDNSLSILCEIKIDKNNQFIVKSINSENNFDCKLKVNQFDYVWTIEKFASLFYRKDVDVHHSQYFQSEIFPSENAPNRYYLRLWPKGIDDSARDFVSIFLYLKSSSRGMVDLNYRLSILDFDGDIYHSGEGRGILLPNISTGKGSSKYIALKNILNLENGLLPDHVLTIYCQIEEKIALQDS